DLPHAEFLRLADGPARRGGVEGLEPRIARAARVDAVGALEVAPRPRDLDPERGEPDERHPRRRRRAGIEHHERMSHREPHGTTADMARPYPRRGSGLSVRPRAVRGVRATGAGARGPRA